jgi:hypothetical protein
MTTAPAHPMDAGYHTRIRAIAAIPERRQWAQRLHQFMRPSSQNERPGHKEDEKRAGRGVPLGAAHTFPCAPSQHDLW